VKLDDVAQFITREIRVERPDIVAAKGFILTEADGRTGAWRQP